jgi:hypothetical protein
MALLPEGSKKFLFIAIGEQFIHKDSVYIKTTQDLADSDNSKSEFFEGNEIVSIIKDDNTQAKEMIAKIGKSD